MLVHCSDLSTFLIELENLNLNFCSIELCFTEYVIFFLQADNASLTERLKDAEDELGNLENLLDKEEVLERLGELKNDIIRKRSTVREPFNDQDDLGRALAELHRKYLDLMRDLDKERRKQVCNPFLFIVNDIQ